MTAIKKKSKLAYAEGLDVTRKEMTGLVPSEVQVDWTRNTSRAAIYTYKGQPCCFCVEDVEDLTLPDSVLAKVKAGKMDPDEAIEMHAGPISLLRVGQQMPVSVYFDAKKRPVLVAGNRRLFAFLILEEHGLLDRVPVVHGKAGQGKIEAVQIERPKDPEGWLRVQTANLAENSRKPCTPIDIAWACRRFALSAGEGGEHGLGQKEAGRLVAPLVGHALSARSVSRYIQLLSLPPDMVAKVHRGEVQMTAALRVASEEGHGRATGSRPGVKHTTLRKIQPGMLDEVVGRRVPADNRLLSAKEVEDGLLAIAGEREAPSWLTRLIEKAEAAAKAGKTATGKKPPRRAVVAWTTNA